MHYSYVVTRSVHRLKCGAADASCYHLAFSFLEGGCDRISTRDIFFPPIQKRWARSFSHSQKINLSWAIPIQMSSPLFHNRRSDLSETLRSTYHAELCRVLFFSGQCEFGGLLKDVSLNTASPHLQYHVLDLGLGGSGSMSTSTMFSRHFAALTSLSVYRWEVRFSDSSRGHRSMQEYYP